jgi:hypothetical protein
MLGYKDVYICRCTDQPIVRSRIDLLEHELARLKRGDWTPEEIIEFRQVLERMEK